MKKIKSSFINMIVSLTVLTLVSGVALGYINELTKGPKAEARKQKKVTAIQSVLPAISNDPFAEKVSFALQGEKDSLDFFPGRNADKLEGVAVATYTNKGYNGLIRLMVGFKDDGEIHDIAVLEQKETPGLGTKINNKSFREQYIGKNPGKYKMVVKKDGGEVDAITGATITTRAFNDAVQRAYDTYVKEKNNF